MHPMRKGHSWNQDLVVRDETVFITIDQAKVARKETQAALVAESQGHGAPETQPFPKDYVGFVYFSLYSHGSQGHGAPETQPFPKDYVGFVYFVTNIKNKSRVFGNSRTRETAF